MFPEYVRLVVFWTGHLCRLPKGLLFTAQINAAAEVDAREPSPLCLSRNPHVLSSVNSVIALTVSQTYGRKKRNHPEEDEGGGGDDDDDALLTQRLSAKVLKEAAAQREEVDADEAGLGPAAALNGRRQAVRTVLWPAFNGVKQ